MGNFLKLIEKDKKTRPKAAIKKIKKWSKKNDQMTNVTHEWQQSENEKMEVVLEFMSFLGYCF